MPARHVVLIRALGAALASGATLAGAAHAEPQPQRLVVEAVAAEASPLAADASVRALLKTPRLALSLLRPGSAPRLASAPSGRSVSYVVVAGSITVTGQGPARALPLGSVLHLAGDWPRAVRLAAGPGAALLAIEAPAAAPAAQRVGEALGEGAWTVRADEPSPFSPPGHANTVNRLLFENAALRVERGTIGVGGGADRHSHKRMEQLGFVLQPGPAALLYMPPGTPHGGEIRATPLDLIVIYSPPGDEGD